jgi:hypothetical protein
MGCAFNESVLKGNLTKQQVIDWYNKIHDQAVWEHGHGGYSGSWAEAQGIDFPKHPSFKDLDESAEWLSDNAPKWGAAYAVRSIGSKGQDCWHVGANCSE